MLLLCLLVCFARGQHGGEFKAAEEDLGAFLLDQREQGAAVRSPRSSALKNNPASLKSQCVVTHDSARESGLFVPNNRTAPPYTVQSCWAMRIRYQESPVCATKKKPPLWRWSWTTLEALNGQCSFLVNTPAQLSEAYFKKQGSSKKTLKVMMLGLSMLGECFQSAACAWSDQTLGGTTFQHAKFDVQGRYSVHAPDLSVADIRRDNGSCTGYSRDHIPDFFKLQPDAIMPKQNFDECALEHARLDFGDEEYKTEICYRYTFNVKKTIKQGSSTPCNWAWDEVDVVLTLLPTEVISKEFIPKTGGSTSNLEDLTIISVIDIYEALMISQLKEAYTEAGLPPLPRENILATPMSCEHKDVHYMLPGITDEAIRVWWAIIATGIDFAQKGPRHIGRRVGGPPNKKKQAPRSHLGSPMLR